MIENYINMKLKNYLLAVVTRHKFLVLISVLLLTLPTCSTNGKYQKLPVVVPFELHKENAKVEVYFKVTEEDVYSYNLYFKKSEGDWRKVLALMETRTESKITDGVPIFVSLEVYKIEGNNEILDTQWGTQSLPLFGTVKGHYNKVIYGYKISPGNYKAVLKATKASPEFQGVQVSFRVGLGHIPK